MRLILTTALIWLTLIVCTQVSNAQPADFYGHQYETGVPLFPLLTFRPVDQARLWAERPSPKFNAYVGFSVPFGEHSRTQESETSTAGPAFDVCLGVKFTRYLFAGVYTGIAAPKYRSVHRGNDIALMESASLNHVPLALDIRGIYPAGNTVQPFAEVAGGAFWGLSDIEGINGFYFRAGAGIEITRVTLSAGYTCLAAKGTVLNLGYVKLGLRIGL